QWDGATLVIILAKIKSPQDSIRLAERVLDRLKNPLVVNEKEIIFNTNIGISAYPNDGDQGEVLLSRANTALQKVRQEGFNHYQFYDPKFSTAALYQTRLENLLQQAIAKRQLSLHYQPQIHVQSGEITAIEALLRWEHPEVGQISPQKIIPIAAQSNLIFELSDWILHTACKQNVDWQKDGLPPRAIAVNLSAPEFYRQDLVMMVAKILNETSLDPQWLELEVTESTLRQQPRKALKILQDLKSFGVRIALDDFGRGQTGIGFITQFPLETIKIDQSLIRQLRGTPQEMAILQSILVLSKGFQYRIVAEGVETETQLNILRQLQCQEVQGFLLSRPLRKREMGQFLQKQLHKS
ncbi:MAG: putative bifunctional diguanylate cyclase/phosphodiesterase, partial [Planktothrix sp.]